MFLVDKNEELTVVKLGQIIQRFTTDDLPKLNKNWNYYIGKQKILNKVAYNSDGEIDTTKVYNKVITNYCNYIVKTYNGYLTGIPVGYDNENFEVALEILKYNDYATEDSELLKQALIFGRAFEICYIDENSKQRFKVLDSREVIPVYANDLNGDLQYAIRFYEEELDANNQPIYLVEVYGPNLIRRYKSTAGFTSFTLVAEEVNYYNMCPVTVFSLNSDETSIFSQVISLQDAYNELLSGSIDDFDAFADAYLLLKGLSADSDDLINMKKNRVLMMDADCSAEYLTKNINDVQVENLMLKIKDNIHKISNCPDFTDENFMAQSGVAIRYKLCGFENNAAEIEANMRKALQRRIELIAQILSMIDSDTVWRDVNITFTRNLPTDLADTVQLVNSLRGLVSTKTLLGLLPFVKDVDAELKAVEEEKQANLEMYGLNNEADETENE